MIIEIKLAKKDWFVLPEGRYRAVLRQAFLRSREDTGKGDTSLRLVFGVTSLKAALTVYVAGKDYFLADTTRLAYDFDSWLGSELDSLIDGNGELWVEKIEGLQGREAVIDVVHIDNGRGNAFRHIQKISPAGTPVEDEVALAA